MTVSANSTPFPCRRGIPHERRIICTAFGMWEELRDERPLPVASRYRPGDSPLLAPYVYVIKLESDLDRSRFILASPVLDSVFGKLSADLTLQEIVPADYQEQFLSYAIGIVTYHKPLTESGNFFGHTGVEVLYRNIMMPAGDDGFRVTHIIGAFNFISVRDPSPEE